MHFMYIHTIKHTHTQGTERERERAKWSGNKGGGKGAREKNFKHLAFIKMNAQH